MIPSPLYKDPIYDGPADPMIIKNEQNCNYYMFYTQRRANQNVEIVSYCYGTHIGVAESYDLEEWHYIGALNLDFEFGHNTFWAPEIIYDDKSKIYHMYVTYIRGVYTTWKGVATIEHYTSKNLLYWDHIGSLSFGSRRIIDPCIFKLPNGVYRMWYKDECVGSKTCYADSTDLYNWEFRGQATTDQSQEGPNVFKHGGKYWLIADIGYGQAVYVSDDCEHFTRQKQNILTADGGTRTDDCDFAHHGDVFVYNQRAFIVYHTHPDKSYPERSSILMAELKVNNDILVCDRNASFSINK